MTAIKSLVMNLLSDKVVPMVERRNWNPLNLLKNISLFLSQIAFVTVLLIKAPLQGLAMSNFQSKPIRFNTTFK